MTISEGLIKKLNSQKVVSKNELQTVVPLFYQEYQNIFLRWATGVSKTKASLDCVKDLNKVLIVIDKNLREQNWIDEIEKWGYIKDKFTFTHYRSLKKYEGQEFDCIISDKALSICF